MEWVLDYSNWKLCCSKLNAKLCSMLLPGDFWYGKKTYTINCPVKQTEKSEKPQVKQMGKQSVKMIVIKWKNVWVLCYS